MPQDPMQALQGGLGAALQGMPPEAPMAPPAGGNPMEGALMGEAEGMPPPGMGAPQPPRRFTMADFSQSQKMGTGKTLLSMVGAGLIGWSDAKLGTNKSSDYMKMLRGLKTDRQQAHLLDQVNVYQDVASGNTEGAFRTLSDRMNALDETGRDRKETDAELRTLLKDPQQFLQESKDRMIAAASVTGLTLPPSIANEVDWKATGKPYNRKDNSYQLFTNVRGQTKEVKLEGGAAGMGASEVKSSTILDDGTSIMVMKDGSRLVRNAEGKKIKGKDAAMAIRAAQDQGALWQGERSGSRRRGTLTADQSNAAFKSLVATRKNIRSYDRAITELDKGANTGVITRMFPSFKESTIRLEQAGRELGLDVIGSVTFGALSEAELNLAMDTAMPTNLKPAALRTWLVDRRDAQTKLAKYYEDAAVYLGTPGNTTASWIASGQMKQLENQDPPPDDANLSNKYNLGG